MKRVDADDFGFAAGRGAPLFEDAGDAGDADDAGPFAASRIAPEPIERVVGELIWRRHRGRANALPLQKLMLVTGLDERKTRGIVEQLRVTHGMRIGASEAGYYMIVDAEDLEAAVGRIRSQIFAMWRTLRVLMDKHALAELWGQLRLENDR